MSKISNSRVDFPWYDSSWLEIYYLAQDIIRDESPHDLGRFVDAFSILKTRANFEEKKVRNIFDATELQQSRELINSLAQQDLEKHEFFNFGRFILHNHEFFSSLQKKLVPVVSELVNEPVETSYNFLSLYNDFGVCEPHLDALSAKWTLDICIDQSECWPIHFSRVQAWPNKDFETDENWSSYLRRDPNKGFRTHSLNPGEGIVFSGSSQWHYRDRIAKSPGKNFCHLVFFHYIPKGTKDLVKPAKWASLFDIPALEGIVLTHRKMVLTDPV